MILGGAAVAAAAVFAGVHAYAGHQTGAVASFTGCLHQRGALVDVAVGDAPASPCKAGQPEVHFSGGDITAVHTPVGGGLQGGSDSGEASLSLATIPAARASSSAVLLVPHDTLTVLPLDREEFDTANLHDTSTLNSRLVAPVAGIYSVSGHVSWPLGTQGSRELFLIANIGITSQAIASSAIRTNDTAETKQSVSTIIKLSAGDFVELEVRQSSGITEAVQVTDHSPVLAMAWLGPG
jgi:hypothetical protein